MINTGESPEFCAKVEADGFGVNVAPGDPNELAEAIRKLAAHPSSRKIMGAKARDVACRQFDQAHSYQAIVELIRNLL